MKKYIFLILLSISLQIEYYSVDNFFESVKNAKCNLSEVDNIKNYLIDLFDKTYTFADIAKNPPQPSFNSSFYKAVNILQKLKDYNINRDDISEYELYHDLSKIIHELNDLHIGVSFNHFNNYSFILPLTLKIKMENDTPVVYTKLVNSVYHEMFDQNLIKKIEKNLNNRVKSINGRSPLIYIEEYCENFIHVKNPHGAFSYNYLNFGSSSLRKCPMPKKKLKTFTLIYENKENITTEYKIYNINNVTKNTTKNKNGKEKKDNIFSSIEENKEIIWDYNYLNLFQCKIDKENQINFIVSRTYYPAKLTLFFDILEKCFKLIYENEFPIIYMSEQNNGGYGPIDYLISVLLSPTHTYNEYSAIRKNLVKYFKGDISLRNKENFETIDEKYFNNTSNEYFTNLFILGSYYYSYYYMIKSIKKNINLSKKRKPNEIILFTDGFSYSAASCLLKSMQSRGSGITVGYMGNPLKKNEIFDSSNSPTAIFQEDILNEISEVYKKLKDINIEILAMSGIPSFENKNSFIPMEYQVFPVDEYFKFYEELNNDTYLTYINEAKRIMTKYEKECNKNNKKLLYITNNCKFENSYTHGGYECGDDGKWTNKCIPSYCDEGYIFDTVDQKCIKDIFYIYNLFYELGITIFIISLIISILIIAGLIYYIYKNKGETKHKEELLINSGILDDEQLNNNDDNAVKEELACKVK